MPFTLKHSLLLFAQPLYLGIAVLFFGCVDRVNAADDSKPYGRVCFSVIEPGPPEKEVPFRSSVSPAAGKKVKAYIDASHKCTVLLAALTKDGKLANGWRPQISLVPEEFEEIELPKASVTWDWSSSNGPFDIYVVFLGPSSKAAEEATKLVGAMQTPGSDDRLLTMQSAKLRELIGRITNEKEKTNQAVVTEPEIGGVFRGSAFPWRELAQSINFDPERPGVLVLSSMAAAKTGVSPAP